MDEKVREKLEQIKKRHRALATLISFYNRGKRRVGKCRN